MEINAHLLEFPNPADKQRYEQNKHQPISHKAMQIQNLHGGCHDTK